MKQEINLIVNQKDIKALAGGFCNDNARAVLEVIRSWEEKPKEGVECIDVSLSDRLASQSKNLLHSLALNLPEPSAEMEIYVCGIKSHFSTMMLLYGLLEAGYKAEFSSVACCVGAVGQLEGVINEFESKYPGRFALN